VYHFDLRNDGETLHMPVIANPYVRRVVREEQFKVVPIEQRRTKTEKRYEGNR
jgi:hypothetical protein